jgi:alpha-D-xyloside xylohydrolase
MPLGLLGMNPFSRGRLKRLTLHSPTLRFLCAAAALGTLFPGISSAAAQETLTRGKATVLVEPYAPNIVRVSISLLPAYATAAPGYGITAAPSGAGWQRSTGPSGDTLTSSMLKVSVAAERPPYVPTGTQADIAKFFNGSAPYVGVQVETADGKRLVDMQGWGMAVPNYKDGTAGISADRRPTDPPFYTVSANFSAANDEHDYGMGQNQEGYLDHRGRVLRCAHDYNAPAGQSVCVPFLLTNKGYGLVWDNPSKTTASFGFNGQNQFSSEVGQRVSFFIIAGDYDAIYKGYRLLTGDTPIPPKSAFGYIQCKQRYRSQAELLGVAHGYRDRHLPIDDLVVDWFSYTKMGQMDMDPALWPDPTAMNRELHAMKFHTMISVWPRFIPEDRYYATLLERGWLMHLADGTPTNGLPYDRAGADIDTTNPDAARWYWNVIRENYVTKGFDAFWADETEPDIPPNGSYFHVGPGTAFFNVYPLFHTAAFYNGMRRDMPERAVILARDSYLGAQHNGAIFWSSDIAPTWDTLRRQIPTGLNFVASGMPYWSTDIGGWQYLPASHKPAHPPLLDPSDARDNVGGYDDYPELYTRWFQYGVFQPTFRSHGSRPHNEVWSYGKAAEPILEKYLRLRYQLMPYIYSLGYQANQTGAPFMRGLFLDFGADPNVADLRDEYMFGPALLVAPVVEQGATSRSVYLPAGTDWYNFWTNERLHGGQRIQVSAPIDTIPLFVRAGSILPLGSAVDSTVDPQTITKIRIYPGADAAFTLFNDDGISYGYEHGQARITQLTWHDATQTLIHTGTSAWKGSDSGIVEIVHP